MIDNNKLAAIEAKLEVVKFGTYYWTRVPIADVRWLIAEVRRLTEDLRIACDIKECDEEIKQAEYARGRADERRDVVAYLNRADRASGLAKDIEFCEHLEGSDGR